MVEMVHVQSENSHISISITNSLIIWEFNTTTGPYYQNLICEVLLYVLLRFRGKNLKYTALHVPLTDTKTTLMLTDRKKNW
jgi:hypothetical protein